jgi:hypothetical protein
MKIFKYFFQCWFHQGEDLVDFDKVIQDFKKKEDEETIDGLIAELYLILQTKNYVRASNIVAQYGGREWNQTTVEKMLNFIYARLLGHHVTLDIPEYKVVYCPICTPDIEKATKFSLIEKATIIQNNQEIFICKPCKLVWLSEDIAKANAQDYKKFMRTLGLKGLWKELTDVDLL